MLANFLGVLPILTPPLCALALHFVSQRIKAFLGKVFIFHSMSLALLGSSMEMDPPHTHPLLLCCKSVHLSDAVRSLLKNQTFLGP
jgi:hypothetical protein